MSRWSSRRPGGVGWRNRRRGLEGRYLEDPSTQVSCHHLLSLRRSFPSVSTLSGAPTTEDLVRRSLTNVLWVGISGTVFFRLVIHCQTPQEVPALSQGCLVLGSRDGPVCSGGLRSGVDTGVGVWVAVGRGRDCSSTVEEGEWFGDPGVSVTQRRTSREGWKEGNRLNTSRQF